MIAKKLREWGWRASFNENGLIATSSEDDLFKVCTTPTALSKLKDYTVSDIENIVNDEDESQDVQDLIDMLEDDKGFVHHAFESEDYKDRKREWLRKLGLTR